MPWPHSGFLETMTIPFSGEILMNGFGANTPSRLDGSVFEVVGEHEPAAGEERDLQESASIDKKGGHGASYSSDRVERTGGSPAA